MYPGPPGLYFEPSPGNGAIGPEVWGTWLPSCAAPGEPLCVFCANPPPIVGEGCIAASCCGAGICPLGEGAEAGGDGGMPDPA